VANGYIYVSPAGASSVAYAKPAANGNITSAWSTTANLVGSPLDEGGLYVNNGYLYHAGGKFGGSGLTTVYYAALSANGNTGSWATTANNLGVARASAGYVTVNGYMYAIGGYDGASAALSSVYSTSPPRVKVGGSLDLVGYSGEYLADGQNGGELTAGNTKVIGTLDVQDTANFIGAMSVQGSLAANSGAYVTVNSTPATGVLVVNDTSGVSSDILFAAQAGGTNKFSVDASGNVIVSGNAVTYTHPAVIGGQGFAGKVDYSDGFDVHGVTTADVDGDGDVDVITVGYDGPSVGVFKNNGDGTYAARVSYSTATNPYGVVAADLDADGDVDLAVTNYGATSVSVLKNNGNGTFATKVDYTTGTSPQSVKAADFDGDGDVDLVVANANSGSNSV
jgi:hypothetical protein